jgi:hypothetical protein
MTMVADHIPYTLLGNIMYEYLQCKAPSLNPYNSTSFFNFRITGKSGKHNVSETASVSALK